MQPGDPALERAQALVALNRPGDALELAGRALASAPDNPDLHALMSRACLAMKRFKEARTHAQAAIALDPENISALSCLAAAYAGLRRFKPAKDAVEAALSLAPATPGLFRQEALINIAAGDDEAGLTAALRARALAPDDPDVVATLADAYLAVGRIAESRRTARQALQLDPANTDARLTLGLLDLRDPGGQADAVTRFGESIQLDPTDLATREAMALALKARNPLYSAVLRFEMWASQLKGAKKWVLRFAPFLIGQIVAATHVTVLLVPVLLLLIGIWAAEPVANLLLLSNSQDRKFVSARGRAAALTFGVAALGVCVAVTVAAVADYKELVPLATGMGMWAIAAGLSHTIAPWRQRVILIGTYVAGAVAVAAATLAVQMGAESASPLPSALVTLNAIALLSGIASALFVAIS